MSASIKALGGKRSALRYASYRALAFAGGFSAVRRVNWGLVHRLVFVCSGNICRSPYAAELARSLGADAVSCGTHAVDGAPANDSAVRIARERHVDLSQHRSTSLISQHLTTRDLVLVAEPVHLHEFRSMITSMGPQVSLLGMWCKSKLPFVPDPYGTKDECFRFVFDLIDESVQKAVSQMVDMSRC